MRTRTIAVILTAAIGLGLLTGRFVLPARSADSRETISGAVDGLASATFAEAEGVLEADAHELEEVSRP